MDKLAQSSYFQHAAKNRYVKRAMDDLSNTPLVLTVEVQWLTGTLAVNIPPWPTDRLWWVQMDSISLPTKRVYPMGCTIKNKEIFSFSFKMN